MIYSLTHHSLKRMAISKTTCKVFVQKGAFDSDGVTRPEVTSQIKDGGAVPPKMAALCHQKAVLDYSGLIEISS